MGYKKSTGKLVQMLFIVAVVLMTVSCSCASSFYGPSFPARHTHVCFGAGDGTSEYITPLNDSDASDNQQESSPFNIEAISVNNVQTAAVNIRDKNRTMRSISSDCPVSILPNQSVSDRLSALTAHGDGRMSEYTSLICVDSTHRRE